MNDRQKAALVRAAIEARFSDARRYVRASEVAAATGGAERRIDMVVLDCFKSNRFTVEGIEVKVSRADLARELRDPDKHGAFAGCIDLYSLAVPSDLELDWDEVPPAWGVYVADLDSPGAKARAARLPKALHDPVPPSLPRAFAASLLRKAFREKPSAAELDAAREEGRAAGALEAGAEARDMRLTVRRMSEEAEAYAALSERMHLWGIGDVEQMDAVRDGLHRLRRDDVARDISRAVESLESLRAALDAAGLAAGSGDADAPALLGAAAPAGAVTCGGCVRCPVARGEARRLVGGRALCERTGLYVEPDGFCAWGRPVS